MEENDKDKERKGQVRDVERRLVESCVATKLERMTSVARIESSCAAAGSRTAALKRLTLAVRY